MEKFYSVHQNKQRMEVSEKLDGTAVYGGDLSFPGTLHAVGVAGNYASAAICSIDSLKAGQAPGVVCVLTAKDIPGDRKMGEDVQDQYIFAADRLLFKGDIVALVVADTYDHAREAAKLVTVQYEKLPTLSDTKTAEGNRYVINPDCPDNICSQCFIHKGEPEQELLRAEEFLEEDYETSYQEHAYIEPEAVVAIPDPDGGGVTVRGSMQNIYMPRLSIHRSLKLPMSRIRIVASEIGGSFGGKLESPEVMAVRAALAALRTGRPVRYVLTREESFEQSHKRHPFRFHIKMGADRGGILRSFYASSTADCGCYANMSPGVIFKAVSLGAGPYRIDHVHCESRAVYTNNIHTGSMRGFGNPQAIFARECAMDEMARRLGMSPYRFRKLNVLHDGEETGSGQKLDFHHVGAEEVLDRVAQAIGYEEKYKKYTEQNPGKTRRRGVGLSLSYRGNSIGTGLNDTGRAYVEVEADGSILVSIGLTEIGQGLRTTMAQIAAEGLQADMNRVAVNEADSSRSPLTGACIASRGTLIGGNAILDACRKIQKIMAEALAEKYQVEPDSVRFTFEEAIIEKRERIPFSEAVAVCYETGRTPASPGSFKVPELSFHPETGYGDTFYQYTYSCIGAEVEVDICTGQTKVLKLAAAHDIGRAMNPAHAKGQIIGGAVMSQGYGLTEKLTSKNGILLSRNFDSYAVPTSLDVREVIPMIVENPDERGPFGARSLGEPTLDPGGGAFINAVNCALGELGIIRSIPADPETILDRTRR